MEDLLNCQKSVLVKYRQNQNQNLNLYPPMIKSILVSSTIWKKWNTNAETI